MTGPDRAVLRRIDLNLLLAFDALMTVRHLSRAAQTLGLSQPGLSHALRRLRTLTGDELFRRQGRVLEPTPYAWKLMASIGGGLDLIADGLAGEFVFDPRSAQRTLTLTASDFSALALLPALVPAVRAAAPGIDLEVLAVDDSEGLDHVRRGEADVGIGVHPQLPSDLDSEIAVHAAMACYADANNPVLRSGLTREVFVSSPHVAVSIGRGHGADLETLLNTFGLRRRIMLTVPNFLLAPPVIAGSDLLAVLPTGILPVEAYGLKAHDLPVAIPPVAVRIIWQKRKAHDPACRWLRRLIFSALASYSAG